MIQDSELIDGMDGDPPLPPPHLWVGIQGIQGKCTIRPQDVLWISSSIIWCRFLVFSWGWGLGLFLSSEV